MSDIRNLRLIHCVPALKKWIEVHPDKSNGEAPLWIQLSRKPGEPLSKDGLKQLIKTTANFCKIEKNKAFPHSFRHLRVYDLLSKGFSDMDLRLYFGWSRTSNMPSVYSSAYSLKDVENKLLKDAGVIPKNGEQEEIFKTKLCLSCEEVNEATRTFCKKCNYTLDVKEIVEKDKHDSEKIEKINERIDALIETIQKIKEEKRK